MMLVISSAGFSQGKQYLYYFDKDLNSTSKEKAVANGIGGYADGLFEIKVYSASDNHLLWSQHFTDSSLAVFEGLYQSYYDGNIVQSAGNYSKGEQDGLWQTWDSSGNYVIDSSFFEKGILTHYIHRGYYKKNGLPDSIIISDMKTNQLSKTYYDDSGSINNEVFFSGEKGLEKFYRKGVFSSTDSVYSREEIEAAFPGGADAWMRYIVRGIQSNADEIYKSNVFGSCMVKFIVNKEGKVTEVEATTMKGTRLAELAVRIISNSPKWIPATQYGRKVNAYRIQPVTLEAPN